MWIRGDVTGKCLISNEIRNDQVRGAAPGLYRSRTAGTGWFLCQAGKCLVTQRSQRSQAMIASFFSRPKTGITVFQFCTNRIVDPAQNNLPSAAQNPGQNFSPGLQEFHPDTRSSVARWFSTTHASRGDCTAQSRAV